MNPVDKDGGSQFAVDEFGGWRENWAAIYVARKPFEGETTPKDWRVQQVLANVIKRATELGHSEDAAIDMALRALSTWCIVEGRLKRVKASDTTDFAIAKPDAQLLWIKRGRRRPRPTPDRYSQAATIGLH